MSRRLVVPADVLALGTRTLPKELAHYVRDVLRLRIGDEVELTDGEGRRGAASVRKVERGQVELAVEACEVVAPPRWPRITLLQAIGKGDKVDGVVRQAAELGVARIIPVATRRAVAMHEGRIERWRAIADDALRLSGRCHRTVVEPVTPLEAALRAPRAPLALCLEVAAARPLKELLAQAENPSAIEALIGPEGGFDPAELSAIQEQGFSQVMLGPYTLRTETAGPALLAILQFALGAFDPVDHRVRRS